jgi:DNA-binding PadR family transcriptional regulator
MTPKRHLGELEQMVMLAVLQLEREAYAPEIGLLLEERARRELARGALYATLDRLEKKGLLRWSVEASSSGRAGSRKRRFTVTPAGLELLRSSREILLALWRGLETVLARSPR